MTRSELSDIKEQFQDYVAGFAAADAPLHPMLRLKAEHSEHVAAEARGLGSDLGWSACEQNAAEALGLLHDIGRFSQFSEFDTFSDPDSVDHGERGWEVIRRLAWLAPLPPAERDALLDGIRYHNRRRIPDDVPRRNLGFLRLVRDADKLDIFRVVLDAVDRDGLRSLLATLPDVALDHSPSPEIVDDVSRRESPSLKKVRNLGDFLLMQLSLVYDLNYAPAYRRLHDRGLLPRIFRQLDGNPSVHALDKQIGRYVRSRMDGRRRRT
ncbi:MAG: HD domain-containing protein [Elusimicrobiota bacterium]